MLYQAVLAPDTKDVSFIYIFNVNFLILNFFRTLTLLKTMEKLKCLETTLP